MRNCTVDGINYLVDLSETNGHSSYYGLKDQAQNKLYSIIKKGMTIYDIGANIGALSLQFSKRVTASGSVISFEPSPINFKHASKNISLNNFKNIKLVNQGLGNEVSSAMICNVNPNNRGMLRILPGTKNIPFEKEEVQINTLDNLMNSEGFLPPDIIKIDVEGYEFKVLDGAHDTLVKYKPILFIELDDNNLQEQNSSANELVSLLKSLGYTIRKAITDKDVTEKDNFSNCHFDILCT
jgi:FkbM family methyltransferase